MVDGRYRYICFEIIFTYFMYVENTVKIIYGPVKAKRLGIIARS